MGHFVHFWRFYGLRFLIFDNMSIKLLIELLKQLPTTKRAFTYDVSSRGGGGFKMLTVADKGGRGSKLC